jgi:Polyketide cyclase / dehydrase and lipid transport
MEVDVVTEIEIARPRAEVAAYAMEPDNATKWYRNIERVECLTEKPLQVGSKLAFVAQFLSRTIAYTYDVIDMVPEERFVMATSEGPFAMETTYSWNHCGGAGTEMILRNRGRPSGFGKVTAPVMATAMQRANTRDLTRLKESLES